MRVAGFVLAGGQSRRMGSDKALLPLDGAALILRIAGEVKEAAGSVAIVGAPERYASLGLPLLGEDFAGCGPLSGIEAALRQMPAGWALVTACDMPGVTAAWLRHLIASTEAGDCDAVVTAVTGGLAEPLCAVYHSRLQPEIRKLLNEGRFSVREAMAQWRLRIVETADRAVVGNVNTPEEWTAWSR